ncbi:PREDICTED: exocyst complex component EXO70B1-like [Ipomoea nil]|uniref:exocyst complex component EXO70B1-like n=1 Tax=Ipomoea nil TaxID=35883 RepID=UPI000901D812|nr:PREDICTED: exocyst complex component EXO70B1-like [Ipomoea nil]
MRNRSSSSASPPRYTFYDRLFAETITTVEPVIRKWDVQASVTIARISYLFRDSPVEAKQFLGCVDDLQRVMVFAVAHSSDSELLLVRAQTLMQIAMKRLQKEFYTILSGNRYFLDLETVSARSSRASSQSTVSDSDGDSPYPQEGGEVLDKVAGISISDPSVADLKAIATCMIGAGYGKECAKVYNIIRKSVIDETLYHLGIEKFSSSQIQKMDWEVLERKILNWQSGIRIAVRTLFLGERILCDEVFSASDHIRESCFAKISKDGAINLFDFLESAAKYKKTSIEKMFRYLDLYEAISELSPEIQSIFSFDSTAAVKSQAATSLSKLGDAIRAMLSEFDVAIQKDSTKPPPGGAIHPLTRYVMNFLVFLADYSGTVSEIIADWPLSSQSPLPESYFSSPSSMNDDSGASTVSAKFAWLVLVLLCKLDSKARHYRDVPLSYVFLANNLNYVVSKVRSSNLSLVLGSDWIFKQEVKVKQFIANYERLS